MNVNLTTLVTNFLQSSLPSGSSSINSSSRSLRAEKVVTLLLNYRRCVPKIIVSSTFVLN